jgi:hypothetical protein
MATVPPQCALIAQELDDARSLANDLLAEFRDSPPGKKSRKLSMSGGQQIPRSRALPMPWKGVLIHRLFSQTWFLFALPQT